MSRTMLRESDNERDVEMGNFGQELNLNQLQRPAIVETHGSLLSINHNHRQSKQAARQRQRQQQTVGTEQNVIPCRAMAPSSSKTTSGKQQKISEAVRELSRINYNNLTTAKNTKPRLTFCRPRLASLSIIGLSALLLANEINLIICDTDTRSRSGDGSRLKIRTLAARAQDPVHRESRPNQRNAGDLSPTSGIASLASPISESHKESILSSLMDSIERKHMKLSPSIRSLALARPSKFDSGSEKLREAEASSLASVQINTRSSHQPATEAKQHAKTLNDIMNQHYGQAVKKSSGTLGSGTGSKADQDLRQIMMLHEQAVQSHKIQSTSDKAQLQTTSYSLNPNLISKHLARLRASTGPEAANSTLASNHLWSFVATPLLSGAAKTGKSLTNVVSYLNPVAAAKKQQQVNSTNPFTPRLNGKSILMGPLLGLGQMFAPDIKQQAGDKYNLPLFGGGPAETQATYVLSNAINQPQGFTSSLKGLAKDKKPGELFENDMATEANSIDKPWRTKSPARGLGSLIQIGANKLAQSHSLQDSFRDLLTLSQLPILLNGPVSTAPSELEPGGKKYPAKKVSQQQQQIKDANRTQAFDDIFRYAYILANLAVRRKRDPLKVLGSSATSNALMLASGTNKNSFWNSANRPGLASQNLLMKLPSLNLNSLFANKKIKPRGVMWDMATDPSLAVTVFHLLERASVALPLGFLLMPFVHMIRHPLNGLNLGRIIPARASHRSVDYEELARKINNMDKMLSRALRPTHRDLPSSPFTS